MRLLSQKERRDKGHTVQRDCKSKLAPKTNSEFQICPRSSPQVPSLRKPKSPEGECPSPISTLSVTWVSDTLCDFSSQNSEVIGSVKKSHRSFWNLRCPGQGVVLGHWRPGFWSVFCHLQDPAYATSVSTWEREEVGIEIISSDLSFTCLSRDFVGTVLHRQPASTPPTHMQCGNC